MLRKLFGVLSRPFQAPVFDSPPYGGVLLSALMAGLVSATLLSFLALEGTLIEPSLFLGPDSARVGLISGGLLGAAAFAFRGVLNSRWGTIGSAARRWTTRQILGASTARRQTPREVEGVYWLCPACDSRLHFARRKCPCGKRLNPFSFISVKRFWIHYRYPDGSDKLEFAVASEAVLANFKMRRGSSSSGRAA